MQVDWLGSNSPEDEEFRLMWIVRQFPDVSVRRDGHPLTS